MSRDRLTVLLASHNPHKLRLLRDLFEGLPLELIAADTALAHLGRLREEGSTFADRARSKALTAASASTLLTLAEASGLEVDALGGRPGVRSAHFAHEGATDAENNDALLKALDDVDADQRTARLRCALCLVDPWAPQAAAPLVVEGTCEGRIVRAGRGTCGFGYDSIFVVDGFDDRPLADLDDGERSSVSHHAAAARAMLPLLHALLARRLDAA